MGWGADQGLESNDVTALNFGANIDQCYFDIG